MEISLENLYVDTGALRVEAIPVTASNPNDLAVCTVYHKCSHVTPSWRIVHQGSSPGLGP